MPTPIDNAISFIKLNHQRDINFTDAADGGARHHSIQHRISEYSALKVYNHSTYGSRSTQGGPAETRLRYPNQYLEYDGIGSLSFRVRTGSPVAKPRKAPSEIYFYTLRSSSGRSLVQFTANAMWLLFDISVCENPNEAFSLLYQLCYGPLNVPLNRELLSQDEQKLLMQQYANTLANDFTLVQVPQSGTAVNPLPRARSIEGEGRDWKRENKAVTQKDLRQEPSQVIRLLADSRVKTSQERNQTALRKMNTAKLKYEDALRSLVESENNLKEAESNFWGTQIALEKTQTSEKLDETFILQLTGVLENFYEAVWVDQGEVKALTKPITMEQEGVMRAEVGQFLVSITERKLDYQRADGRVVLKSRIGRYAHAPHHSADTICWGIYNDQIKELTRNGDYAQLLLMTYHHLESVTPDDAYVYLPDYCKLLHIDRKMDLLAGETEWKGTPEPLITLKSVAPEIVEIPFTPQAQQDLERQKALVMQRMLQDVTPAERAWVDMGTLNEFTRNPVHRTITLVPPVTRERWVNEGRPLTPEERAELGITAEALLNPENELQQGDDL